MKVCWVQLPSIITTLASPSGSTSTTSVAGRLTQFSPKATTKYTSSPRSRRRRRVVLWRRVK